jgi:hypothetical protein
MTTDASDNGKPTCCGPGDLSACKIETAEERKKTESKAKPPKKKTVTDQQKKRREGAAKAC